MNVVKLDNDRITLICGDSVEILTKIKPNTIDLCFADPPYYNVVKDAWDNDWADKAAYLAWCKQWISLLDKPMKESASFYVCGGVGEKSDTIIHIKLLCDSIGLYFKDWITWKKDRGMGTRRGWVYTREECLWYVKNNKEFQWNVENQYGTETRKRDKGMPDGEIRVSQNGYKAKSVFKRLTNVWSDISEQSFDVLNKRTEHSTPKPYLFVERIVKAHMFNTNMVVLDPFLGTGTTGEVCATLGLRFIGIEKNEATFNEAVNFIQQKIKVRNDQTA